MGYFDFKCLVQFNSMIVFEEANGVDEVMAYSGEGDIIVIVITAQFPDFLGFRHGLDPENIMLIWRSLSIEGTRGDDTSMFIDNIFVFNGS